MYTHTSTLCFVVLSTLLTSYRAPPGDPLLSDRVSTLNIKPRPTGSALYVLLMIWARVKDTRRQLRFSPGSLGNTTSTREHRRTLPQGQRPLLFSVSRGCPNSERTVDVSLSASSRTATRSEKGSGGCSPRRPCDKPIYQNRFTKT
ncbi:hypothetical protein SKAU_G00065820 [Synaphobranchus kaupii]|uniref:Secreted protein n=1 Tax=Synaphobranchus kaupii TaxID=118154 RepID=A0A9Q1G6V2_SYNKA|nr:hypothetical protein SKAU_G00065820 [Synaphobranchus kaupii]